MVKARAILDIRPLSVDLCEEIEVMGGDPNFVKFVLAWHGVLGFERMPFPLEPPSHTAKRRIKRRLQKAFGQTQPSEWKDILFEWRRRPTLRLKRTLFKLEPLAEPPPHRARQDAKWRAVCDLRNYFRQQTGQPKMYLIEQIMDFQGMYWQFNAEWQRRKSWFCEQEAKDRLDLLITFFTCHHHRILTALETGIPLYEQPSQDSQEQEHINLTSVEENRISRSP